MEKSGEQLPLINTPEEIVRVRIGELLGKDNSPFNVNLIRHYAKVNLVKIDVTNSQELDPILRSEINKFKQEQIDFQNKRKKPVKESYFEPYKEPSVQSQIGYP